MTQSLQFAVRFANFCIEQQLSPNQVAELIVLGNRYARRRQLQENGKAHGGIERARLAFVNQAWKLGLLADAEQDEAWTPVVKNSDGVQIRIPYE